MQLKTILNRVTNYKSFVVERAKWAEDSGELALEVKTDRLTPSLPRSVGFLPVFFPAQWRLGHRPVHALPFPLDPF